MERSTLAIVADRYRERGSLSEILVPKPRKRIASPERRALASPYGRRQPHDAVVDLLR